MSAIFGLLALGPLGATTPVRPLLAPQSRPAAVGSVPGSLAAWSHAAPGGESASIPTRHLTSSGISPVSPVADWGIGVLALAAITAGVMTLSGRRRQN